LTFATPSDIKVAIEHQEEPSMHRQPGHFMPLFIALAVASSIAVCPATRASADIYKYVDDSGTIHFSNVPDDYSNERVVKEKTAAKEKAAAQAKREVVAVKPSAAADSSYFTVSTEQMTGGVPYAGIISAKCDKYGVDPSLVKSIIKTESNFDPTAVSPKGARGLMQLMPATAADMGVSDSFDPEQNIEGGVRYFRSLLDNFRGDVELSVAAYNCGQGRVIRNGMCVPEIPETKNYVKKVMQLSKNPITGMSFSRPIYRVELKDGSVMFTESPVPATKVSLFE